MTRPPLINTDIADLPSRSSFLLSAGGHRDGGRLLVLPVDVRARGLQLGNGLLRVRVVRHHGRRLLDHTVRLSDSVRLRHRLTWEYADDVRYMPDVHD